MMKLYNVNLGDNPNPSVPTCVVALGRLCLLSFLLGALVWAGRG